MCFFLLHTSSIRERRIVIWVTCGEAELVSTNPKLSFSFVTMFRNSSTLWNHKCRKFDTNNAKKKIDTANAWSEKSCLLTFLCGITCGMYCRRSWALFFPFSSSWNNKLGFRSLNRTENEFITKWEIPKLETIMRADRALNYLLAKPVVIRGKPAPAVPFIQHHQPTMNAMKKLQFFSLCIFYKAKNLPKYVSAHRP